MKKLYKNLELYADLDINKIELRRRIKMIRLIDLAGYKLIENETKNSKTYTLLWWGNEQKKVKTLKEAIEYIYLQERKYLDNNYSFGEMWKDDKTN